MNKPLVEELCAQLAELLDAFESFMEEANWGASVLTGETVVKANQTPLKAKALLARAKEEGGGRTLHELSGTHERCPCCGTISRKDKSPVGGIQMSAAPSKLIDDTPHDASETKIEAEIRRHGQHCPGYIITRLSSAFADNYYCDTCGKEWKF